MPRFIDKSIILPKPISLSEKIRTGRVLPIIGAGVDDGLLLGRTMLTAKYANHVQYPFAPDRYDLAKIVKFRATTAADRFEVNYDFLNFVKRHLLWYAEKGLLSHCGEKTLADLTANFHELTFSSIAERLNWVNSFELQEVNIYHLLANLPLPIFITTNYHSFLELALERANKHPQTEICNWHRSSRMIPSVFEQRLDYEPTIKEPLVYHLHGLEQYPESLVLSEDDYTQHLVAIVRDTGRSSDLIPALIRQILVDRFLLLLGYSFDGRDFENITHGLIRQLTTFERHWVIQIDAHDEQTQAYMRKTEQRDLNEVYFGTPEQFIHELYVTWQSIDRSL